MLMLLPEFSENTEKSMLLYFNADGADTKTLGDEIEKMYVCYNKMTVTIRDGHRYVVIEIEDEG